VARIEIIDQTLRDGQQSYWGMRMRAGQMLPVAEAIDTAGYRVVDLTGSSIFEVMVRFRQENPWKGLDAIHGSLPRSTLRAGTRTNGIVGMNVTPSSIVELWIRTLAKHGIESLWIFDCLHDIDQMLDVARIARDAGVKPSPQINFSQSPVHTDEYYADLIERMVAGGVAETIVLGDEAGVLGPERARRWIRLMKEHAGDVPLELHFHNRTAMANLNHVIGVEEGVTILHSAISTLANGVSMPSTEMTIDNMRRLGHEVDIDDSRLAEVAEHFGGLADDQGFQRGAPVEYSIAAIQQQFPGGMMGTLREQLKQVGMTERCSRRPSTSARRWAGRSWRRRSASSSASRRC
jgi:oxaloacetate decarboxylase alpha subunit